MDFPLHEHEERLRREVCDFLSAELGTDHESDPAPMPPGYMPAHDFELKLGAKGWLGISWPLEYGGGGADYVINGRKVYTSGAELSEYCWLAARTDPDSTKHAGVSIFIVPMDSPGVEVSPLMNLLDEPWFNEVVFENVRVPVLERGGQENAGWQVLTSAPGGERLTIYRPC